MANPGGHFETVLDSLLNMNYLTTKTNPIDRGDDIHQVIITHVSPTEKDSIQPTKTIAIVIRK